MAYNPAMYQTYGNMYGGGYGSGQYQGGQAPAQYNGQYPAQGQQSYGTAQALPMGIIWVDGEVGAKAHQMPAGWPVNTPLPLWDTNDTIIYLKSTNQMGMPNPLQRIHYRMEEQTPKRMGQSGTAGYLSGVENGGGDLSEYVRKEEFRTDEFVRKDDLERIKAELMESINSISASAGTAGTAAPGGTGAVRRNAKGE